MGGGGAEKSALDPILTGVPSNRRPTPYV